MTTTKEVLIFIHGVTPKPQLRSHSEDYDVFSRYLQDELGSRGKTFAPTRIDIGWGYDQKQSTLDRILEENERKLLEMVTNAAEDNLDPTLNPARILHNLLRETVVMGLADLIYYIDEDGKREVRKNVLSTLLNGIPKLADDDDIALTIISHSAGTVIMHDVLYIIFGNGKNHYLSDPEDIRLLERFKTFAKNDRLFIKFWVTLGSPLTPLMVRSANLLNKFYNNGTKDGKLDLEELGIKKTVNRQSLWLNLWDKDDILSYPIAFLYNDPHGLIQDRYLDIGDGFPKAHTDVWKSDKVTRAVANYLENLY